MWPFRCLHTGRLSKRTAERVKCKDDLHTSRRVLTHQPIRATVRNKLEAKANGPIHGSSADLLIRLCAHCKPLAVKPEFLQPNLFAVSLSLSPIQLGNSPAVASLRTLRFINLDSFYCYRDRSNLFLRRFLERIWLNGHFIRCYLSSFICLL